MIKRNPSKANMSLVNSAQEDHFIASKGIHVDTAVTDLTSVNNSINFELNNDGSLELRKELVLKDKLENTSFLLFDKKTYISFKDATSGRLRMVTAVKIFPKNSNTIFKYTDYDGVSHIFTNTATPTEDLKLYTQHNPIYYARTFPIEVYGYKNFSDHTLICAAIDYDLNVYTAGETDVESIQLTPAYVRQSNLRYRFIKIYKDIDSPDDWVFEILFPEFNSITSELGTENLDINLLLDNPYAIRDLYNYGANTTTKILAYHTLVPEPESRSNISEVTELPMNEFGIVTEGPDIVYDVILKAFITTSNSGSEIKYYCCWEYSADDGVTWKVSPEFINKFNLTEADEINVSDLSNAEFEKALDDEDLHKASNYLVAKKVAEFNSETLPITDQYDSLHDRVDVLDIPNLNTSYKWRFSIYAKLNNKTVEDPLDPSRTTDTFLVSQTGAFKIPYGKNLKVTYAKDLKDAHERLFKSKIGMFENHYYAYSGSILSFSNLDEQIFPIMNNIEFNTEITGVCAWRNYLIVSTEHAIKLVTYDYNTDSFSIRTISETIGIPKEDGKTLVSILNSIYFKSGYHIYKLVPNLYSSTDTYLNLHIISDPINTHLENLYGLNEYNNFAIAGADKYYIFIPIKEQNITYCYIYDITTKSWMCEQYHETFKDYETYSLKHTYIYTESNKIFFFNEDIKTLLHEYYITRVTSIAGYADDDEDDTLYNIGSKEFPDIGVFENVESEELAYDDFKHVPYGDFLEYTLVDVANIIATTDYDELEPYIVPINFMLDFGQKSSTYSLDKQFLETKLILATLTDRDNFPVSVDISTDGDLKTFKNIHIDANTDSALYKTDLNDFGTLSTDFMLDTNKMYANDTESHTGIIRQMILKYSGKGKTIRHLLRGSSKFKFKFYSMDVRYRVLPNKQ